MANYWTKNSGDTILTLNEQVTIAPFTLPLSETQATVTLISGSLPAGIYLDGIQLKGTPREVARDTISTFVLRATFNNEISDRTYKIKVQGPDAPQWVTPEDLLAAGNNNTYFILDSAPIDFQLEVLDTDVEAGQTIEYFLGSKAGELPPGIQLTKDGRLVGVVDPIRAIDLASESGRYDEDYVGLDQDLQTGYDWSVPDNNGFDSFYYDTTIYDLSTPTRSPKKLNRYYQFTVTASDGDTTAERTFRLYVVGDDFLRADNTIMVVGSGTFTADITHIRVPIWLTPSDFGFRRANNYVTLVLDVIDPNTLSGVLSYYLKATNDDGSPSILPPGLSLDTTSGEIAGRVPYQPAITKEYKFTVAAQRIGYDADRIQLLKYAYEGTAAGLSQLKVNKFDPDYVSQVPGREFTYAGRTYTVNNVLTKQSTDYDILNLTTVLIDSIPKATSIDLGTITAVEEEVALSSKTFTIKLLGEVDSTIAWVTPKDLGDFSANYISTLSLKATTTVPNGALFYTIKSGTLPPGLTLALDGEIIGKVRSFGSSDIPGLTVFDSQQTKFDQNETRLDRTFTFTATAQDKFGFSAIDRQFTITLSDPDDKLYSNLYMSPLMTSSKRKQFNDLINDSEIFAPELLYRPNDPNFGLQTKIKMLLYPGIETKDISNYVGALSKNAKRKRLTFGAVKTAVAKTPGTNDVVYEVVYLEVKDKQQSNTQQKTKKQITIKNKEKVLINSSKYDYQDDSYDAELSSLPYTSREDGKSKIIFADNLNITTRENVFLKEINVTTNEIPQQVSDTIHIEKRDGSSASLPFTPGVLKSRKLRPTPENTITVDLNALTVDGLYDTTRYNSSLTHIRDNIRAIGETEKNFMPLWMQSSQEGQIAQLGLVNAIPLCYCKPGTSKNIANLINLRNIDFTTYDLDIDRVIIDSTTGQSNEQYIVFANYEYNV
jgi:hypothetical protein